MKKSIHVKYFALLREQSGKSEEKIETSAKNSAELFKELSKLYGFSLKPEQIRISINDQFQTEDTPLRNNDSVVFIPPVAGG